MRPKIFLKAVGDEVRERRRQAKLSQEALAHRAGIHTNIVGRLERGDNNPTLLTLLAIASELGVSVADLLGSALQRTPE